MMKKSFIVLLTGITLFNMACSTSSKKKAAGLESTAGTTSGFDPNDPFDPFGGTTSGSTSGSTSGTGFSTSGSTSGTTAGGITRSPIIVGSGTNGSVTATDRDAFNAIAESSSSPALAPADNGYNLPQELLDEANRLLEEERRGRDVSAQKSLLAGKIMQGCTTSKKFLVLAPFQGQPLMGQWIGSGTCQSVPNGPQCKTPLETCSIQFTVNANQDPDTAAYRVTGSANGTLNADNNGNGALGNSAPFAAVGLISDEGKSGTLRHPTLFVSTKYQGKTHPLACQGGVRLTASTNPIPENFKEAIRIQAQCQRQALFFLSPIMDNMFRNMDPASAKILQENVLGLKMQ